MKPSGNLNKLYEVSSHSMSAVIHAISHKIDHFKLLRM